MHGIGTQIDRLIIEEDVSVFLSLKYINSLNFFYLLFFINFQKKLINSSLLHGQRCTRVTMLGLNKWLRRNFKNKICQKINLSLNYLFMEKKNLHYVWEKFKRTKKFKKLFQLYVPDIILRIFYGNFSGIHFKMTALGRIFSVCHELCFIK